jgi:hypothetical protein
MAIGYQLARSSAKRLFFDRPAVMRAVDPAKRRALARFGGFVRQTARRSIRKRKRSARPGEPPSSHSGELRRGIFFAYEPSRASVVIGPARLNGASRYRGKTVPQLMEEGGTIQRDGQRLTYDAHPFMGPAFDKGKRKLIPGVFRDSVKSTPGRK